MTPEVHEAQTNAVERQLVEDGGSPAEPSPVTPAASLAPEPGTVASRPEESHLTAPPVPPSGSVAASLRRIPPGWRWALGISLAFFSGLSWILLITYSNVAVLGGVGIGVMFAFALAAGYVLSVWWMVPLLAIPIYAGAWLGAPFGAEPFDMFGLLLLPLLVAVLIGTAIGQRQGVRREVVPGTPWTPAISLAIGGGFLAQLFSFGAGWLSVLLAVTCLAAGWLLRSWWGLIAVPVAYVGVAALLQMLYGGGVEYFRVTNFTLYVALPAVVMSAAGIILGKRRGTAPERADEFAAENVFLNRRVIAIVLVVVGACFAALLGGGAGVDASVMLVSSLFALTCLAAGWLLRSWWGFIATLAVYVAVAALVRSTFGGGGPPGSGVLSVEFALSIVLPAVVMSAIGTGIGMLRARRRGGEQPPLPKLPAV